MSRARRRGLLRAALVAVCATLSLGAAGPALAQQRSHVAAPVMPSPLPAKVDVKLTIVRASLGASFVDPRLSTWTRHLERMPFQRFDLLSERTYRLYDGARQEVPLPDGHTINVTLASHDTAEAKVGLVSRRPGGEPVETVLTIKRNRSFVYVLQGSGGARSAVLVRVDVSY